ncbi:MAG: hypothetical protein ACKOFP_08920 [Actinomycetota bacterium]
MSYTQLPDGTPMTVVVPVLSPSDSRRRALTRAAVVRHPGLVDITSVREVETGLEVSFCPPAGARQVEVDEREWAADDVVRLLAPVAAGLAQLHDADCTHGAVALDRVWVRPDGAGLIAPGIAEGVATDDIRDLVSLMRDLLPAHSVGGDLASLLIMGADPDVSARPSMARVAAILDLARRGGQAAPVGLARRRSAPLTSPPTQRRAGTCPEPVVFPLTTPSAKVPRARHAAPAGTSRAHFGAGPARQGRLGRHAGPARQGRLGRHVGPARQGRLGRPAGPDRGLPPPSPSTVVPTHPDPRP